MIGHPDEHDVARWLTADMAALRDDLDHALHPEAGPSDAPNPSRPPSDAELIDAVRGGDIKAYGQLYERHLRAARSLARYLSRSGAEADDLVSDAFAKVLDTLRAGGGPDSAFRAYLFTALRHTAYDRTRRDRRISLADDVEAVLGGETSIPFQDPAVATLERSLATKAFASLPERWQTVLWQTEIEGQSPAEVAPLLGLTTNGVSALAYRAREGLRKAYLQAHLARNPAGRCRATVSKLGSWTRGGLTRRETLQTEAHLDECGDCRALAAELADVNGTLRAIIAPLVLGIGAPGYLATTAGAGAAKASAAVAAGPAGASGAATSASQWLGVAASTTAVVVALVWTADTGQGVAIPTAGSAPTTLSVAKQAPTSPSQSQSPTPSSEGAVPPGATTSGTTAPGTTAPGTTAPPGDPTGPVPPPVSVTGEPNREPLVPLVPAAFAMGTGGPPVEMPITVRNTGPTSVEPMTLTLSLPEGIQVVGPGNNLLGGSRVWFGGAAEQRVGCPAGKGTVTCPPSQPVAAGDSVTFVLRLLAGPAAASGTITGSVRAGSAPPVPVEVAVSVTPKK